MEEEGVVIEVKGTTAFVRMLASGGCEGCSAAGTCKAGAGGRVMEAENAVNAAPGQCVVLRIESAAFLKASFLVYMVPVIMLFMGAALGGEVGPRIYMGIQKDFWQAIFGVLSLLLSVVLIRLYDKKVRKIKGLKAAVVRIKEEG